jgi:hypothetical protein
MIKAHPCVQQTGGRNLAPVCGLYEYAKAVAKSLKVSFGRSSRRSDSYRKHSGRPLQVRGAGGYHQDRASPGEGGDSTAAPKSGSRLGPRSLEMGRTALRLGSRPLRS